MKSEKEYAQEFHLICNFLMKIPESALAWDDEQYLWEISVHNPTFATLQQSDPYVYVATGKTVKGAIENFYKKFAAIYIKD